MDSEPPPPGRGPGKGSGDKQDKQDKGEESPPLTANSSSPATPETPTPSSHPRFIRHRRSTVVLTGTLPPGFHIINPDVPTTTSRTAYIAAQTGPASRRVPSTGFRRTTPQYPGHQYPGHQYPSHVRYPRGGLRLPPILRVRDNSYFAQLPYSAGPIPSDVEPFPLFSEPIEPSTSDPPGSDNSSTPVAKEKGRAVQPTTEGHKTKESDTSDDDEESEEESVEPPNRYFKKYDRKPDDDNDPSPQGALGTGGNSSGPQVPATTRPRSRRTASDYPPQFGTRGNKASLTVGTFQLLSTQLEKMAVTGVPRPGPAKLGPNSGLDEWLEEAKQCHYLPENVMKELCETVKEVLMEESNIQPVCTPVTICGDIHGQFYDLLELFRVSGGMPGESDVRAPSTVTNVITSDDLEPPSEITDPKLKKKIKQSDGRASLADEDDEDTAETGAPTNTTQTQSADGPGSSSLNAERRYIFLGDFVDRGYFSLETFTLLMCLKAKYPDKIVLVRGNHESRQITQVYGFYEECQQKYGNASVWKACCHVFDFLVLAAIVDGEILCVHGGLSPEIRTIDQIRVVARAQEIPHEGAFCDLVWSDPEEVDTWAISPRGAGWLFGDRVATEFNHVNGLKLIARAHQLVNEGFKYHFAHNSVVTVWSAPNYCYRCGNVASIMEVNKDLNPKFSIFSAVPDDQRHTPPNRRAPGDYFL